MTLKIPKFNSNKFLKAAMADTMYMDANQFLWRVAILLRNSDFTDRNWLSKIYVDILMAIESDLKCIIICLSKSSETPENAYKTVRKKGHNISNLYIEAELRAKHRLKFLEKRDKDALLNDFIKLSVNNRYELVTFYDIRDDIKNLNFKENSTKYLLTHESLSKLELLANNLHAITKKARHKLPQKIMTGNNILRYSKRFDKFKNNIKL